jgi:hypothetical protein
MAVTRSRWLGIVARGWQLPGSAEPPSDKGSGKKTRAKTESISGGPGRSRNTVLSDFFQIYESGVIDVHATIRFLRRHLLSDINGAIHSPGDCDWTLTELFLSEVLGMEQQRIDAIRTFADGLAQHIKARNDRRLFVAIDRAERPSDLRNALTKAQRNEAKANNQLLFGLDDYLAVFEADDSIGRVEWKLIRDLISIRLVEQLHKASFLDEELLAEEEESNQSTK